MNSSYDTWALPHVDCSIRTSTDQSLLATPRSFSQLATSFIGSQCQGIHLKLFVAWPCVLLMVLFVIVVFFTLKRNLNYRSRFFYLNFAVIFIVQFSRNIFATYRCWWAQVDSNHRPYAYQAYALTTWAMSPYWLDRQLFVSYPHPLVEMRRIELLTPCVQGRCSPSWATPPYQGFGYAALT